MAAMMKEAIVGLCIIKFSLVPYTRWFYHHDLSLAQTFSSFADSTLSKSFCYWSSVSLAVILSGHLSTCAHTSMAQAGAEVCVTNSHTHTRWHHSCTLQVRTCVCTTWGTRSTTRTGNPYLGQSLLIVQYTSGGTSTTGKRQLLQRYKASANRKKRIKHLVKRLSSRLQGLSYDENSSLPLHKDIDFVIRGHRQN